ncbi:alternative ribosome rescue aminoacyl-tRNA hydrolase ArfB [Oceanobacter mangrovi]|uniref:alternative ribosome rescue aminoacyl-tRNA hydrolase ArfB n=1 Tax=Oceanobacter mangrovi TaxID=2862510 RepID=UPI001C8E52C9|nr:alternative ribosome rescue aminoacyl-tRNA hydrolase ArfB [Oceanobacter mangrovi]
MADTDNGLYINHRICIPMDEIDMQAIRAQGAGGQNVNKVSSAIHLRFDIANSSLPEAIRERLLEQKDSRLTKEGVLVIKAQQFRTQEKNREDALERLREMVLQATVVQTPRIATRPTRSSQRKRVDEKNRRGQVKAMRGKVSDY